MSLKREEAKPLPHSTDPSVIKVINTLNKHHWKFYGYLGSGSFADAVILEVDPKALTQETQSEQKIGKVKSTKDLKERTEYAAKINKKMSDESYDEYVERTTREIEVMEVCKVK